MTMKKSILEELPVPECIQTAVSITLFVVVASLHVHLQLLSRRVGAQSWLRLAYPQAKLRPVPGDFGRHSRNCQAPPLR
jgi:hypothetical protein